MWTVSLSRDSKALFAQPFTSISPKTLTIAAVREKMRSAAIKTKEAWDFVQLTFNLDTINWRWRMKEGGYLVDYFQTGYLPSEAGINNANLIVI